MKGIALALAACLVVSACAKSKVINGKEYEPYGLATQDRADPNIKYEISFGSMLFGFFFSETIIAPVYIVGWNIMEPVGPKAKANEVSGS